MNYLYEQCLDHATEGSYFEIRYDRLPKIRCDYILIYGITCYYYYT